MNDVTRIASSHGFAVTATEELPEIEGVAYTMNHVASGARLLYLQNDDANKAFSIAFKTPAADDTGVFHILEHSVLCGSRKFPVKEPFVNLLKSSMQTFLNAMTFPDKTMYPVASTNERDLLNLMDVYLDAVFFPAIYQKRAIFEQEGWHFEVADDAAGAQNSESRTLTLNGVVYNEMKGALSDPDSVLYNALSAALFPDTTYRFESGGTPTAIPKLTYEAFLENHRRHYRPDNSYLLLYGDMDLEVFLAFIDEEYLGPLAVEARGELDINPLEKQSPVVSLGQTCTMSTAPENACMALGFVAGDAADRERMIATDILIDAVMGSNEAPMKRALLDADIAADASAYLADAVLQPFAVVQLKSIKPDAPQQFRAIVEREARRLADGALDHALIDAALAHAEFVMRERNFGYADGVVLAMSSLAGLLYDDSLATAYLRYEDAFASLRERVEQGYFEQLLRELFLENDHKAEVELIPVERDEDDAERARLALQAEDFSADDFARVAHEVTVLRAAQETPDAPEDVAKLPQLSVSDLGEAPHEGRFYLMEKTPLTCLRHDVHTHGIVYAYLYFDLTRVSFEDLPLATILAMVLGKLGTARHTAAEIDTLAQSKLGNLSFFTEVHEDSSNRDVIYPKFVVSSSALAENVEATGEVTNEILLETDFSDYEKIRDILNQKRVIMEQGCAVSGHSVAMARVASYYLPAAVVREQIGGMDFYRYLKDLVENFDERADDLARRLKELSRRLFIDDRCVLSFTGSDEDMERYWSVGQRLGVLDINAERVQNGLEVPAPCDKHEAFIVPADVTFTSMGSDRRLFGGPYEGAWLVALRALSYDYLWNEVRVKGGAYGAGFQMTRAGSSRFYSYRDPHVDETIERFKAAGAWLEGFDPAPSEMDGYVVSTTAGVDAPCKPRDLVRRQDGMFFSGYSAAERRHIRDQVVATTPEQVRGLGAAVTRAVEPHYVCTVGNREIIERSKEDFCIVDLLGK